MLSFCKVQEAHVKGWNLFLSIFITEFAKTMTESEKTRKLRNYLVFLQVKIFKKMFIFTMKE